MLWGRCQLRRVPSLPALCCNTSGEAHPSPEMPCAQRLQAASGSRGRWFCLRDPHICKGNHINYLCSPTQFFIHEDSTPTPQVLEKNKKFKRKKWANDPSDWRVIGKEKKSALCVRQSLSRVRLFATPWTLAHQAPLSMEFARQEYRRIPFSRGFSWPRDWTQVSSIAGRFFTIWPTRECLERVIFILYPLCCSEFFYNVHAVLL